MAPQTAVAVSPPAIDAALIERVLIHGDLRQLTPAQKVSYYNAVCQSVGLNPLTQPFQYLVLNGKEILYARRAATEQLRRIHEVSIQIMGREVAGDCYVVTARATLPSGRQDENIGAVPIANVQGENRANAMMKAETKAKRRVTLAICGLGMLDETEVDSIAHAEPVIQIRETPRPTGEPETPAAATVEDRGTPPPSRVPGEDDDLPRGTVRIVAIGAGKGGALAEVTLSSGESYLVWKQETLATVKQCFTAGAAVAVELKKSASGNLRIERVTPVVF